MKVVCAHCGCQLSPQLCRTFKDITLCVDCLRAHYEVVPRAPREGEEG